MIQQQYSKVTHLLKPSLDSVPGKYKSRMTDLFDTWSSLTNRNRLLTMYYNMKNNLKDLGISIPEKLIKVNCAMGWCKKAIDAYVVRSTFDGFVFKGIEDDALNKLVNQNHMRGIYKQACRASLIHGLSAVSVMKGNDWQPLAKVRAFSANQFSALWDKDENRISCGVVLSDIGNDGSPRRYIAHFPDAVLVLNRIDYGQLGSKWDCEVLKNDLGRPTMELIPYDPDLDRPLGHSFITPEIQGIVDKAMRDVFRMEIGAEFFTFPQRYVLGASEDLFSQGLIEEEEKEQRDSSENESEEKPKTISNDYAKYRAYIGAFLAISRDENGDIPQVGQFAASPAENFTHVFENDAQRFSGATNVPLAQLGVLSNTYTSSDALSATNDPLILSVEDINRNNEDALQEVARMMMAVSSGRRMDELTKSERDVQAIFVDPSMPTMSARADAWTKLGAQDPSIVGTRIYYEKIGLSQAEIDRLMHEKITNGAIASLSKIADNLEVKNDRQSVI